MERLYSIEKDGYAKIELDKKIYNLVVIEKALSNFLDKLYIKLKEENNNVFVFVKLINNNLNLEDIIGNIYNDLLKESLRYNIALETKNLRELIVGRALYTTCIDLNEDVENNDNIEEDYSLDDIAVNWFDNNGEK